MDDYEATRILFSRVQNLDPENASKIMGVLLLQDHGEKEIIRLAFGPEALIHSMILKARNDLGLHSNSSSSIPRQAFASSKPGIKLPSLSIPNSYPNQEDFLMISPNNVSSVASSSSSMNSSASSLPPYGNGGNDVMDEFLLQDQLSFLPIDNPDLYYHPPCLYYARGFCKNGNSCRFSHLGAADSALNSVAAAGSDGAAAAMIGKVEMMEQCSEFLRSKSALPQRLAAASANCSFPYSPKSTDFLLQQHQNELRRAVAALTMAEDSNNLGRFRLERNDFSINYGAGLVNPAARQIYLTFPSDSTFKEEDVSKYFSIYGPVQDVRIPYQQKRMFGFVTFLYSETVKLILAKGNPHFVCDSRVLVKPYKEKGKVPEKFRKQQMERGDFSPCGTPTSLDSRELHDLNLGARMFFNNQDMLWRRKLEEEADLQQAIELQTRRLMSLKLLDVKKPHRYHPAALSTCSTIPSPTHSPNPFNQNLLFPSILTNPEVLQDNGSNHLPEICVTAPMALLQNTDSAAGSDKSNGKGDYLQETSLEHNLPDSPFASSSYETGVIDADDLDASANNNSANSSFMSPSNLGISSFKSFNCQYPSSHGAIGMYAGTGGPTCPVGI